jgi:hypothetical protein
MVFVNLGWFVLYHSYTHIILNHPLATPHNTGALFAIMAITGACSVTILPVGLEMGCELTRNAEGSSAIMWATANAISLVFLLGTWTLLYFNVAHC